MTYLTVPISVTTVDDAVTQAVKAVDLGAEMVELRTDYLENLNVEMFDDLFERISVLDTKIIVTCRDQKQGGANDYSAKLRLQILERAIRHQSDFVDCEYVNFNKDEFSRELRDALKTGPTRLILSHHDFEKPIKDMESVYDGMLLAYPDCVPKIVFMPKHINDCFAAFDLLKNKQGDAIVIAMGEEGMITRILARKLGSMVCFACMDFESMTAPGQVTLEQMKNLYRFDKQNSDTEIFGIIANPVGHSMSPAIHNACLQADDVNAVYVPVLLKGDNLEFSLFIENVKDRDWLGVRGFSVSLPHKENALYYINSTGGFIDEQAVKIGALNTLTVGYNERICGYNTDYEGAISALVETMGIQKNDLLHKKAAVIGAGGVARAVVAGLTDAGAKVTIYNRTVSRAKKLAKEFTCKHAELDELQDTDAEIIVNCTSIGMHPDVDASPVPDEIIKPEMTVFDTVYNPPVTKLLKQAENACAKTVSGVDMFVYQAMAQYKHFTGKVADQSIMRDVIGRNL